MSATVHITIVFTYSQYYDWQCLKIRVRPAPCVHNLAARGAHILIPVHPVSAPYLIVFIYSI